MKCVNCKKEIGIENHYYEVVEYEDLKELSRKYVHKNCQDNYDKKLKQNLKLVGFANSLGKIASDMISEDTQKTIIEIK